MTGATFRGWGSGHMTVGALLDALNEFATDDVIITVTADEYGWNAVTRRPEPTSAGSDS